MYTQCLIAESELHTCGVSMASMVEDRFATMPEITTVPAYQPLNEEELHTSFEMAISDRLIAVNRQLSIVSGPLTDPDRVQRGRLTKSLTQSGTKSQPVLPASQVSMKRLPALFETAWQRSIIYASLVLALTLIGFDLMGLLILHAR
ncbi:MAG TPA: hypothetical protein VK140_09495 [Ktedonobacteraceae bacterium]|nr:hypothetical protein [Ktedonobacteraceae bacterium]